MKGRDRVAGWAIAGFIVLIALYCALWAEGCSYDVEAWWHAHQQERSEPE